LIRDCLFERGKLSLGATAGSTLTVEECIFAGKQRANRDFIRVGGPGEVTIRDSLIYDTLGDGVNNDSIPIQTEVGFTGTLRIDHCTLVHQDTRPSPAIRSLEGGTIEVKNSIVHLTQSGQIGIAN
jgi:hypothetical protein